MIYRQYFQHVVSVFHAVNRAQFVQGRHLIGHERADDLRHVGVLDDFVAAPANTYFGLSAGVEKFTWSLNTAMRRVNKVPTSSMSPSSPMSNSRAGACALG